MVKKYEVILDRGPKTFELSNSDGLNLGGSRAEIESSTLVTLRLLEV